MRYCATSFRIFSRCVMTSVNNLETANWTHEKGADPDSGYVMLHSDPATGTDLLVRFPAGHVIAPHFHESNGTETGCAPGRRPRPRFWPQLLPGGKTLLVTGVARPGDSVDQQTVDTLSSQDGLAGDLQGTVNQKRIGRGESESSAFDLRAAASRSSQ
jgi:hypothetical protein